jgi:hypothetical protein
MMGEGKAWSRWIVRSVSSSRLTPSQSAASATVSWSLSRRFWSIQVCMSATRVKPTGGRLHGSFCMAARASLKLRQNASWRQRQLRLQTAATHAAFWQHWHDFYKGSAHRVAVVQVRTAHVLLKTRLPVRRALAERRRMCAQAGPRLEVLEAVKRRVREQMAHPRLILWVRQVLERLRERDRGPQRGRHALRRARVPLAEAALGAAVEAIVPLERKLDKLQRLQQRNRHGQVWTM